ncbi:MAG: SDR family oxidoreductase [Crocinitomicaceae bacterium]|nr:SDR family oxidoreductase [Crocinitomicaceae bacterium]MDG1735678.1 SDR family oxidoreductase [Crocinitomicaceae bacterium]MDG2504861.1 SDR family oxidoreductase [Crocinitomicaceae bacterium]
MKILITGSNGLLGQKLVKQLLNKNISFLASSKGENRNPQCPNTHYVQMDITNLSQVSAIFQEYLPSAVIHTAAITNVDYCESNISECKEVNVAATNILFHAAQSINAQLIALSTDFVFDGVRGNYKETDAPNPLSVYAKSKLAAEQLLQVSNYKNWAIVRTIIVFGEGYNLSRSNIVLWAKEALASGKELNIIDDQFRAPTWADDLAWACIRIAMMKKKGMFHISGPETFSIYDLVLRVAKSCGLETESLNKTTSESLNQAAKRPPKTGFDLTKARKEIGYNPMSFEESLKLLF